MEKFEKHYNIFLLSLFLLINILFIFGTVYYYWFYKEPVEESKYKKALKNINIPNCDIDALVIKDNVYLAKCEEETYYTIDRITNHVIGPMSKEKSMEIFKEYLDIDMLKWEEQN